MKTLIPFILLCVYTTHRAQSDAISISGRTAPNFKLENIEREIIELNDYIGKGPVLLCSCYQSTR